MTDRRSFFGKLAAAVLGLLGWGAAAKAMADVETAAEFFPVPPNGLKMFRRMYLINQEGSKFSGTATMDFEFISFVGFKEWQAETVKPRTVLTYWGIMRICPVVFSTTISRGRTMQARYSFTAEMV